MIYEKLLAAADDQGAGYLVLIDPDRSTPGQAAKTAVACTEAGVNALLVGTSILVSDGLDNLIKEIKSAASLPVILFPGGAGHLSREAHAVLFLSLISGRNPQHLIGDQVAAAPALKQMGLETIPTGYMLISSGAPTTVEFISNTQPLPRNKPGLAAATALAGQYLGLKIIYLEAGSGADKSVPDEMISAVRDWIDLPLIVGGGIRSPEEAVSKVRSGADFVVVGTAFENKSDTSTMKDFSDAVHSAVKSGRNP